VAVAINTQYRQQEVEDLIERSGARLLILQPQIGKTDYRSLAEQFDSARIASLKAFVMLSQDKLPDSLGGRQVFGYDNLLSGKPSQVDNSHPDLPCNVFTSSGTT